MNTKNQTQHKIDEMTRELIAMKNAVATYEKVIEDLKCDLSMHKYESHDAAETALYGTLENKAFQDCEGAYNCGQEVYSQEYMLTDSDVGYLAELKCEYNRHDKTYYYLDCRSYSYKIA